MHKAQQTMVKVAKQIKLDFYLGTSALMFSKILYRLGLSNYVLFNTGWRGSNAAGVSLYELSVEEGYN